MTLANDKALALTQMDRWFRYNMPYALQHLDNLPGQVWLPVNRNYKLIGQINKDWVEYHEHEDKAMHFARDPRQFTGIFLPTDHPETLYLYDDGPSSRRDYFARLEKLFAYAIKLTPKGKGMRMGRYAD